jgi:hypothetical protein
MPSFKYTTRILPDGYVYLPDMYVGDTRYYTVNLFDEFPEFYLKNTEKYAVTDAGNEDEHIESVDGITKFELDSIALNLGANTGIDSSQTINDTKFDRCSFDIIGVTAGTYLFHIEVTAKGYLSKTDYDAAGTKTAITKNIARKIRVF